AVATTSATAYGFHVRLYHSRSAMSPPVWRPAAQYRDRYLAVTTVQNLALGKKPTLARIAVQWLVFRKSRRQQESRPRTASGVQLLARLARSRHCYIATGRCSAGDDGKAGLRPS